MYGVFTVLTYWCFMPIPIFCGQICAILPYFSIVLDLCISCSWEIVLLTVIYKFVLLCVLLHFHHFDAPASFYTSVLLMVLFGTDLTFVCDCVRYLLFTFLSESNQVDICPLWCCFLFFVVCLLLQMSCRSSKGKDIVIDDPSTPVAKRTRLSS